MTTMVGALGRRTITAVRGLVGGPRSGGSRLLASARIDRTRAVPPARSTIDNDYYEGIDELWWDPTGPAAVLHAMNRPRLGFYLRALSVRDGTLVLDAGCGGGLVAKGLAEAGATVVGLDRSAGSLGVARRAVAVAGGTGRFAPVRGQLERLPFADASFDAVIAADVLEHVADLPAAVAEIARVLAPGGSLAFDTINRTAWAWLTALWGAERLLGCIPRGTHDWRLFIRPAELDRLLRRGGLEAVTVVGLAPRVGPRTVASAVIRRRIPVPMFATGRDRRASYLGHYRRAAR